MKTFQAIVGMLAVVIISAQTLRHIYVRWFEPRESVLNRFDTTKQGIAASKSLDDLVALYEVVWKKVQDADQAQPVDDEDHFDYRRRQREPYKSEVELREAIAEWESHQRQLAELHFFWWAGLGVVALGAWAYVSGRRWLGLSAFVLGYLEMIWAASPSFSSFGYPVEFERLLTLKVIYSACTLGLLLLAWFGVTRESRALSDNTVTAAAE